MSAHKLPPNPFAALSSNQNDMVVDNESNQVHPPHPFKKVKTSNACARTMEKLALYPQWIQDVLTFQIDLFVNRSKQIFQRMQSFEKIRLSSIKTPHPLLNITLPSALVNDVSLRNSLDKIHLEMHDKLQQLVLEAKSAQAGDLNQQVKIDLVVSEAKKRLLDTLAATKAVKKWDDALTVVSLEHIKNAIVLLEQILIDKTLEFTNEQLNVSRSRKEIKLLFKPTDHHHSSTNMTLFSEYTHGHSKLFHAEEKEVEACRRTKRTSSETNEQTTPAQAQYWRWEKARQEKAEDALMCLGNVDYESDLTIFNLSKVKVNKDINFILNKGLKYIINTSAHKKASIEIINQCFDAVKRLSQDKQLPKYAWVYDRFYRSNNIINVYHKTQAISMREYNKLSKFLKSNHLVLKPADKNLGWVLMDFRWYKEQIDIHLKDENTYYQIGELYGEGGLTINACIRSCQEALSKCKTLDKKTQKNLLPTSDVDLPEFYVLPKVHKEGIPTRPIIPNCNSPSTKISKWLDAKLQEVLKLFPWILPGTKEFINMLEYNSYDNIVDPILMSADVVSLYTNIPLQPALRKFKAFPTQWKNWNNKNGNTLPYFPYDQTTWSDILILLEWVLNNNFFTADFIVYLQTTGVAMGTNCAPTFANLYLGILEFTLLIKGKKLPPGYVRYIDDTAMIINNFEVSLWQNTINSLSPHIKWTYEIGYDIPFLDLHLFLGPKFKRFKKLDFKPYSKPGNRHLYTSPTQNYPSNYKYSWITGENIRLLRNSSTERLFNQAIISYKKRLRKRNYDKKVISEYIKYNWSHRDRLLLNLKPKPFDKKTIVIKFNERWPIIRDHLQQYLNMIGIADRTSLIIGKGRSTQFPANQVLKELTDATI